MSMSNRIKLQDQILVCAVFALLGLALLAVFVLVAEPAFRKPKPVFTERYDEAPFSSALAGGGFQEKLAAIDDATRTEAPRPTASRLTGSPGCLRTEALIRDVFDRSGLEVASQEFTVAVPHTQRCEILGEDGRPLEGVSLYPFMPSVMTPISLPDEGIRAKLVQADSFSLAMLDGCDPERSVVMTTLDAAAAWSSLQSVGVPAVIVYEDAAAKSLRSSPDARGAWDAMLVKAAQPYPRFYAAGEITRYAGQTVTIRCNTAFRRAQGRNIVGVLKGTGEDPDALVLTAFYDSYAVVPELAPGGEEAVSLAALLQLAEAFAPYRGRMARDVVFVATAGHAQGLKGVTQLMRAIRKTRGADLQRTRHEEKKRDDEEGLAWATQALAQTADAAAWTADRFAAWWSAAAPAFQKWLNRRTSAVAGEMTLEMNNRLLEARLAYLRAGSPVYAEGFDPVTATDAQLKDDTFQHPLLKTMRARQIEADRAANFVSMSLPQVVARREFGEWAIRTRLADHLTDVAAYHRQSLKEAADYEAMQRVFAPYRRTLTVSLQLNSGGSRGLADLAMLTGIVNVGSMVEPIGTQMAHAIRDRIPLDNHLPRWRLVYWGKVDVNGTREFPNNYLKEVTLRESEIWTSHGRLAFSLDNYTFIPQKVGTPENRIDALDTTVARGHLAAIGPALLSAAHGKFEFQEVPNDRKGGGHSPPLGGYVFGNAGTGEMVPSHPMAKQTFVRYVGSPWQESKLTFLQTTAIDLFPVECVNPYGWHQWAYVGGYVSSADAARYDESGRVLYITDTGGSAEVRRPSQLNIPVFRCAHVALPDSSNPRTMRSFAGISCLASQGLAAPAKMRKDAAGIFLEPDFRFYVGLLDGAPDNPRVQTYRAFMLNVAEDPDERAKAESDIQGRGYLAADVPVLTYPHFDAAESMLFTHGRRLELQKSYKMADERMLDFEERGRSWLEQARKDRAALLTLDAVLNAGRSLSYAINNHPVIRDRISQAVVGILWYLGLLVPFVFFFEKLVFGFTDIRKQLLAMGAVFLVVFGLLRVMHPAFQMVRSSLMILIGFIMFLLTVLVTLMVGGKFKQNIKELRHKEGRVEGADVNRSGVIGTAFMLGLNNMRRRKVRTALTCITLILITFVMICFTSVSSDLVNIEHVTGRSNWNGLQIQKRGFLPLTVAEIGNIKNLYERRHPVTVHTWLTSILRADRLQNAEIEIDRAYQLGEQVVRKRSKVNASVQLEWSEPLFSGIDKLMTPASAWFPRPPQTNAEKEKAVAEGYNPRPAVILPDTVARALDIRDEDLARTNVMVQIRGDDYQVLGIIDALALSEAVGMDGKSLLPYDINAVQALGTDPSGVAILPDDVARLSGGQVILVNRQPQPVNGYEHVQTLSCRVLFPQAPYTMPLIAGTLAPVDFSDQRKLVLDYLERVGEPAYYGVDGVSYYGSRVRAKTFEGVLQILLPIVIAALTVFSTMRGSVYERRGEIYVYNAVGIAPNHVFFMFMAEAAVYAVVGAMVGYLLSQGVGSALVALDLTRGMNMNYSSIETIYASLAIVGSVLLSTILPARSAARLAAPSEVRTWRLPEIVNDELLFDLPFTFTPYDRVAILSYMSRWFDAHGEGGSGQFFAAPPQVILRGDAAEAGAAGVVPVVATTVWLKPYDLGVSQRVEILLPTDAETREFIARVRLVRLSGTTSAWERTLKPFMGVLRKQFLNWRAASSAERSEMYEESKAMIQNARVEGESHVG